MQDFSKINAGLMTLESIPLDLASIVERTLLLLHASAADRGVTLTREVCDDFPQALLGDPLRVQQASSVMSGTSRRLVVVEWCLPLFRITPIGNPLVLWRYVSVLFLAHCFVHPQIIVNLVNNALKFCQGAAGGGKVRFVGNGDGLIHSISVRS